MDSPLFLILTFAVLVVMFARRLIGKSVDDLIRESVDIHHHVHRVLHKHPKGGSWREFSAWMDEEQA